MRFLPYDQPVTTTPYGSWLLGREDESRRALRIRIQLLLTVLLVSTNVVGAGTVVGLLLLVRPSTPVSGDFTVAQYIAVPTYVAVAVLLGAVIGTRTALRALRWATEGRRPSAEERRRTLRVPMELTLVQVALWTTATALFSTLAGLLEPTLFTTVLLTVGIATAIVGAIAYLFSEFTLRPVAARALADGDLHPGRGSGVRRRLLVFWTLSAGVPTTGLMVVAILALAGEDIDLTRLAVVVLVIGGVTLGFGMMITVLSARAVVAPLTSVRRALASIEKGQYDVRVPVYDGTELGLLQAGMNRMAAGLAEREQIRDLFGRHVGREVAEAALTSDVELGGETRTVSVVFVDLIGSTTLATQRPPAEVVELLNRFFTVVVDEVDAYDGLVNKFIGDAVLAVFNAPVEQEDHERAALGAARAMARRLADEVPELEAGIGVASGEAVAGNVGDRRRFEYTVIGDAVNQAARLCELAKKQPGRLLAADDTVRAAGEAEAGHWVADDEVVLRGRDSPTRVALLAEAVSAAGPPAR